MTVTYHSHAAGTFPLDDTVEIPGWQGGARKFSARAFKRLRINPAPISAAGSDQSGATALTAGFDRHFIAACSTGAGVRLPVMTADMAGEIWAIRCSKNTADHCLLYPPFTGQINENGANNPILIRQDQTLWLLNITTVNWETIP